MTGPALAVDGRRVALKWHKLRQAADDPPFAIGNLRAGLALDAVLEIDIRRLADGAWICLHDGNLDDETDGHGRVDALDSASARELTVAGGDFPPPLLADVAAELARADRFTGHLQLDLKEPSDRMDDAAIAGLARALGPAARHCVLSGYHWPTLARVGARIPGLRLGYDPYEAARGQDLTSADELARFVRETLALASGASAFYLHHRFVRTALDVGVNPVRTLQGNRALVDVWTLDPSTPDIGAILEQVVAAGADQITTNAPSALADIWARRS